MKITAATAGPSATVVRWRSRQAATIPTPGRAGPSRPNGLQLRWQPTPSGLASRWESA